MTEEMNERDTEEKREFETPPKTQRMAQYDIAERFCEGED